MGTGYLTVQAFAGDHTAPVANAQVYIRDGRGGTLYELATNINGLTERAALEAPEIKAPETEASDTTAPVKSEANNEYFNCYNVEINASEGYNNAYIRGVQLYSGIETLLPVRCVPAAGPGKAEADEITIPRVHSADITPVNTRGIVKEPPKIPVAAGEVMIPEFITVHLGEPDAPARNVRVPFIDYVKNAACCAVYPWWDEAAVFASVYTIVSFALNRLHTRWYRGGGKDFDITASPACDQMYADGRDLHEPVSAVCACVFNQYIKRLGFKEPYLCGCYGGPETGRSGLSLWGALALAKQGYTPLQILKHYFPKDIDIYESNSFEARTETYPGYPLKEGGEGEPVKVIKGYLNRIRANYDIPAAGKPDGVFDNGMKEAVTAFQRAFSMIPDGVVDRAVWYAISAVYAGCRRHTELISEGQRMGMGSRLSEPGANITLGSKGELVIRFEFLLSYIAQFYSSIPYVIRNGVHDEANERAARSFRLLFGLDSEARMNADTWNRLYEVYYRLETLVKTGHTADIPGYPGVVLDKGSIGDDTRLVQVYLNAISGHRASIPAVETDGVYGQKTAESVLAFQRITGLEADGKVGHDTWYRLAEAHNSLPEGSKPRDARRMNPKPFISAPKKPARPAADGYPGEVLQYGGSGDGVRRMQSCLSALHPVFPVVPNMPVDGEFGPATQASVKAFQSFFGLDADGAIGPATWNKVITVFRNLPRLVSPVHPGSSLRAGSRGQSVQIIQKHINGLASVYPCIPAVEEDGIYGPETEEAVRAFQRRFGLTEDGVIGADVWNQIISRYNLIGLSYNPDAPLPLKTQAGSAEGGGSLMAMMLMMMFMREMGA